jgi:hypothetical protein
VINHYRRIDMPNMCNNTVRIKTNSADQLNDFLDRIRGPSGAIYYPDEIDVQEYNIFKSEKAETVKDVDGLYERLLRENPIEPIGFHHILPVPNEVIKQGFDSAGYYWQSKNWGTKWEALEIQEKHVNESEVIFKFETTWGPPIGIYNELCNIAREGLFLGVSLRMDYSEPDMEFCGYFEQLHDAATGLFVTHDRYDKIQTAENDLLKWVGPNYLVKGGGFGVYA